MWLAITNSPLPTGNFQTLLGPIFPPIWVTLGPSWGHIEPCRSPFSPMLDRCLANFEPSFDFFDPSRCATPDLGRPRHTKLPNIGRNVLRFRVFSVFYLFCHNITIFLSRLPKATRRTPNFATSGQCRQDRPVRPSKHAQDRPKIGSEAKVSHACSLLCAKLIQRWMKTH